MKKEQREIPSQSRRNFLRHSVAGAGVVGVATVLPVAAATLEPAAPTRDKPQGYRLTDHILTYYKTLAS